MEIIQNFIQGKMDKDSDSRLVPKGVYREGINIRVASSNEEDEGAVHKIKGTLEWDNLDQLENTFVCLGAKPHKDYIYAFYLGDSGNTFLFEISRLTQTYDLLFELDLGNVAGDIIDNIEIVENNASQLLILWNDKSGPPRSANITTLRTTPTYYAVDDLQLIKAPPIAEPELDATTPGEGYELQYKDQVQMAVQHIYENGEESAISFYGATVFDNKIETPLDVAKYALSANGDGLSSNVVRYSTDFGVSWTSRTPNADTDYGIRKITQSLYGNIAYVVARDTTGAYDAYVYLSEDYGDSWAVFSAAEGYLDVACDNDGIIVYSLVVDAVAPTTGEIRKKIKGGADWVILDSFTRTDGVDPFGHTTLACNAAGDVVYVITTTVQMMVSVDEGATFETKTLPFTLSGRINIRCNSVGNVIYIQDPAGVKLYVSFDYGTTWREITSGTMLPGFAIDSTGSIVYALIDLGPIYLFKSVNAGLTFSLVGETDLAGTITYTDVVCDTRGEQGLVYLETAGSATTAGYYFNAAGAISARTLYGRMSLQGVLSAATRSNYFLRNDITGFDMDIETGSKHVTKIRLLYRNASSTVFYVLDELDKALQTPVIGNDTTYIYTFDKSSFNRVLSANIVNKLYDNVPHVAGSMTLIGNKLVFGDYKDGYTIDRSGVEVAPDFAASQQLPAGNTGLSIKAGTTQKYGIVYYDDYNRMSKPFIDPDGSIITFSRVFDEITPLRRARITITHLPPDWATKYKIVRAKPIIDYRFVTGLINLKTINEQIYIYIGATEGSYVIGDALEAVSLVSGSLLTEDFFVYIEDVIYKDATFVTDVDAGFWAVITPPASGSYTLERVVANSSKYPITVFYLIKYDQADPGDIFYEIPGTFLITGGYHMGNVQNQTVAPLPAISDLVDGDVFWSQDPFYIEKFQTQEGINFNNLGRATLVSENFKQINRYASLTHSGPFVPDTGYNGLSSFNLSEVNWKDLDIGDGAIKLIDRDFTDLLVLQEDFVSKVLVNKDVLQTASGTGLVSGTALFLGQQIPYAGDFGFQSPGSYSRWGNVKYFPDKKRGVVLRLSQDGLTPISKYGFKDYFNELFRTSTVLKGAYDPRHEEYVLHDVTNDITISFSETKNGFPTFFTYSPDYMLHDGVQLWSFKDEFIWKHNATTVYNNFYGVQYTSKIVFVINDEPDIVKLIESISLHGDDAWVVNYIKDRFRSTDIPSANFENKEGLFYASVPKAVGTTRADKITDNVATQGLGTGVTSVVSKFYIIPYTISASQASIGDDLWYVIGTTATLISDIVGIVHNSDGTTTIEVSAAGAEVPASKFFFVQKNSYLEGDSLRDCYFEVELEHLGGSDTELFSVSAEVKQSKQ